MINNACFLRGQFQNISPILAFNFPNLCSHNNLKEAFSLYSFLESLLALLKGSGVKGGSLKQKKSGNELALSHRDSVALYRIMYNNLHDSDIYLGRKYKLFTRAIETLYGKNAVVA